MADEGLLPASAGVDAGKSVALAQDGPALAASALPQSEGSAESASAAALCTQDAARSAARSSAAAESAALRALLVRPLPVAVARHSAVAVVQQAELLARSSLPRAAEVVPPGELEALVLPDSPQRVSSPELKAWPASQPALPEVE
jgi:hypothetical protein